MLTPVEEKLLRLALDKAAPDGEWMLACAKLFHSLRERAVDGYTPGLAAKMSGEIAPEPTVTPEMMEWPGSIRLGFGKHAGKKLAEIDPGYLAWYCNNADQERNAELILAMKWVLQDLRDKKRRR